MKTLDKLKTICEEHFSIDTYAKKIYLTNEDEFKKLKAELSFYFTLVQIVNPPDKRYDNFFASILSQKGQLPPKVKVISWNYDFQLEMSYSRFYYDAKLHECRQHLNTCTPSDFDRLERRNSQFLSIKLNGTAAFKSENNYNYLVSHEGDLRTKIRSLYNEFYSIYDGFNLSADTDLKFAWENEHYGDLFRQLKPQLQGIQVLVVIGYSFPYFNREVDVSLFKLMPSLQKIYIQDCYPANIQETMEEFIQFRKLNTGGKDAIHKENLKQFVFPKELDITLTENPTIKYF